MIRSAYIAYVDNGIAAPERVERFLLFLASSLIRIRKPLVIGITGSVGKTTTATAIATLLRSEQCRPFVGRIVCTVDNMNNHDGLSLTVLGIPRWQRSVRQRLSLYLSAPLRTVAQMLSPRYPRVLVLEYGSDRTGYLSPMVRAVPPSVAVITTIGHAHLAGMGDLRGVMTEKATLLSGKPAPQLVLLGTAHAFVSELAERTSARTVRVNGAGLELSQQMALHVGRFLGIPDQALAMAPAASPLERRLQLIRTERVSVVDDTFNANPTSVRYALEQLDQISWQEGRKIAVLGSMAELGSTSQSLHEELGAFARERVSLLVSVGEAGVHFGADLHFRDSHTCASQLASHLRDGDLVLVKGSASLGMQVVVKGLLEASAGGKPADEPT